MRGISTVIAMALLLQGCGHQPRYSPPPVYSMTPVTTHGTEPYTGPSIQDYDFSKKQVSTLGTESRGSDAPLLGPHQDKEPAPKSEVSKPTWYRVEATVAQIAFAKEKAAYDLKDPSSAQFRDLYAITRGLGDDTVCGEINAKNSYGAYVGFRKFYVYSNGKYLISDPDSAIASLPQMVCDKPLKP